MPARCFCNGGGRHAAAAAGNLPGFSARVQDLRVRTYPGVGHMPMEEIPARSLADFQWFLDEIGA